MPSRGPGKPPAYAVRFPTFEDFVVAYNDHLRHHRVVLPLGRTLPAGTTVRLRIDLPDGSHVRAEGTAAEVLAPGQQSVELHGLGADGRRRIEACLANPPVDGDLPANEVSAGRLDVVLVDDSVSVRLAVADALRERGMRVRAAASALEAVALALKRLPHVLVSDVEMPDIDGWQLLRMVRARPRLAQVPVVFLTQLDDEASRLKGYRLGVDDYVPKDTSPDELAARIAGVVGRRWRSRAADVVGGLRGDLRHVSLGSVLGFLETERRTGSLHLEHPSGDAAVVHLRRGALEAVESASPFASVDDRLFELLAWQAGTFEFVAEPDAPPSADARTITYLVLEFARRKDEEAAP
ncbi:MAG: response regulator [Deltaproteobacteria bacterium]|nr:MAG: response regulator [Deltaproteobacteria bacterium]